MSLSWRKRVAVAIYPDRLAWLRAGPDGKVAAKGTLRCPSEHDLLPVFQEALGESGAGGGDVALLLSNRLVRYAVVANPDSANGRQELDLLTRHAFERVHGAAVDDWELRLSSAAPGRAGLASAVDRTLVSGLRDAVMAKKARLASIRPYLMAACNEALRHAPGLGLFVHAEPQRICQLAWHDHGWLSVSQTHADADWQDALPGLLDRMVISLGLESPREYRLCAPELNMTGTPHATWQAHWSAPRWPQGLSPADDRAYAGAMLALV